MLFHFLLLLIISEQILAKAKLSPLKLLYLLAPDNVDKSIEVQKHSSTGEESTDFGYFSAPEKEITELNDKTGDLSLDLTQVIDEAPKSKAHPKKKTPIEKNRKGLPSYNVSKLWKPSSIKPSEVFVRNCELNDTVKLPTINIKVMGDRPKWNNNFGKKTKNNPFSESKKKQCSASKTQQGRRFSSDQALSLLQSDQSRF